MAQGREPVPATLASRPGDQKEVQRPPGSPKAKRSQETQKAAGPQEQTDPNSEAGKSETARPSQTRRQKEGARGAGSRSERRGSSPEGTCPAPRTSEATRTQPAPSGEAQGRHRLAGADTPCGNQQARPQGHTSRSINLELRPSGSRWPHSASKPPQPSRGSFA